MKITHVNRKKALGKNGDNIAVQCNYNATTIQFFYTSDMDFALDFLDVVALFKIKPKAIPMQQVIASSELIECDQCHAFTECTEDDFGDYICKDCQDNRDEEQGTRFLNDPENFTSNGYSQYKSLK